jgi:hypothetical protein
MTGLTENMTEKTAESTIRRATAPAHIMEAVSIVRSFLARLRNEPKDPNERFEWIR